MAEINTTIINVHDLKVWFPVKRGLLGMRQGVAAKYVKAVDGVTFDLNKGETLALVGESGSGKTTVARALMSLLREARGEIWFGGLNIVKANRAERLQLRTNMQMIFQDPFDGMNPRETIYKIVGEPLKIHKRNLGSKQTEDLIARAIGDVGLMPPDDFLHRYPHELSGGQRQRVLIAVSLILEPSLIIADEPVSMLDASLKVEILNLMAELKQKHDLTYLIITHDLALTRYTADRIAIMYLGKIVEMGPSREVLKNPFHPYTQALIQVVPTLDRLNNKKKVLGGEIPHPSQIPDGCRFHPRCPIANELCSKKIPEMRTVSDNCWVACHNYKEI